MLRGQGDRRQALWRQVLRLRRPRCLPGLLAAQLAIVAAFAGMGHALITRAHAQLRSEDSGAVRHIVVTLFKSRTMRFDRPFASAVVGSPDIVDTLPMSDRELYIQGKKVGTTNISVFDNSMRLIGVLDVEVTLDTGNLEEKIRSSTDSRGIRVNSTNGQVVLSGVASNSVAADRAVQVAKSLVPEGGSIVNAMKVAPAQQVMLRVRFLEATRTAGRELGVNWIVANNGGNRGFRTGLGTAPNQPNPGGLGRPPVTGVDASGNPIPPTVSGGAPGVPIFATVGTLISGSAPFGTVLANLVNNGKSIDLLLTALETKGLIRRLAEPDLVALSGDTAAFLAGGEFPVPVVQPGGTAGVPVITVEYKPFGVQLTFMPTVLANGLINLRLAPSVSELDFAQSIQISGFTVPSLTKREARTTIELRDGQSFAIAGLLQADNRRNISQLPWIGSVPVLGALFRSSQYLQQESDLVVIVTPHLVAPAVPGQKLATPFDNQMPTNDVDFFLMGQMEQRKTYTDYVTSGGDTRGPYGHLIRVEQGSVPLSTKN
jgi:pilus assembly protein CpaC